MSGKRLEALYNPKAGLEIAKKDLKKVGRSMKRKPPKAPAPSAPVSMSSFDLVDTSRSAMRRERARQGLGSTILASSYRPAQTPVSFGARTLLGSAG